MGEDLAYAIIWSKHALRDLANLTAYIAADNPEVAERFGRAIIEKVAILRQYPLSGAIVPERNQPHVRQLIQMPFRIIYRVKEASQAISILRIWHGARGEPKLGRQPET